MEGITAALTRAAGKGKVGLQLYTSRENSASSRAA
jgi:hypothetical protein